MPATIDNLSGIWQIAKLLYQLTERNFPFKWTTECQQCLEELKDRLTTTPVLAYPDYSRPFILDTDANDFGIGAVLAQHDDDGHECVVAFASRTLSKSERRYCVIRRELLAVVVFTQHFRPCLLGRGFILRTEPWFPNMVTILQGTRGAAGTMVGEASRNPDMSMVLRAKEATEKPDVDMQKAQSLETRRLLQLWEQLEIRDGILFRRWENMMALKVCIN